MKLNTIIVTKFCFIVALACSSCKLESQNKEPDQSNTAQIESANDFNYSNCMPSSTYNQIIKHRFYTLSYAEKYEQAEWVAYELTPESLTNKHYERPFFIKDNLVKTESADWRNYKKSGFDKGHLCPAGDMKFSVDAFEDTFYTSNISPQTHDFNSGIWNKLEEKVRYWAKKYNGIYVITGPVLTSGLKTIGRENVAVPNYFYKILVNKTASETKVIAFLLPSSDSQKPLYTFVVSVDELEKVSGIDFFAKLPDAIENELEKNSSYKNWSF